MIFKSYSNSRVDLWYVIDHGALIFIILIFYCFAVGGGSAGAVLANRLSEIPEYKVLLLEAGGHETILSDVPALAGNLQLSKMDWRFKTEPQDTACQAMAGKVKISILEKSKVEFLICELLI